MIINGKNIYIAVRNDNGTWYPIACDSTCTLSLSRPSLEVTGPTDGLWRRVIPGGIITGTITGNGLINFKKNMSLLEVQRALIAGTQVSMMCQINQPEGGYVLYECLGYVVNCEMTGAYRAAGSFSYEIDIDGAVTIGSTVTKDATEVGIENFLAVDLAGIDVLGLGDEFNLIL